MKISVCIPVYNGAETIGKLVHEVLKTLKKYRLEIVLVNDGSSDRSEEVCEKLARKLGPVKFISLRKNFGEHNAVMCALNYATGDYAAIIDDDFQNPPAEIIKLVEEARKGFDVVYSRYEKKRHTYFRNLGSRFNNLVSTWLLNKPRELYLSSFKVIHKDVIREMIKYTGPFPYVDGLILRITNNISSITVEHSQRATGKSGYTLKKLISLWLNMFINFSIKPLRIFTFFGLMLGLLGIILIVTSIIEKLLYPETPVGWTFLVIITLIFSGVQLTFLGLIGEYVGKQYLDVNKTPQWTVKKEIR